MRTRAILLLGLMPSVLASIGDRSPSFKECTSICMEKPESYNPGLFLSLTGWSRESNCAYECTQLLTNAALGLTSGIALDGIPKGRMVQYYGKWPFVRYFGMQELCSVVFSIMNLYAHFTGWRAIWRTAEKRPRITHRSQRRLLALAYGAYSLTSMIAWAGSTVFHIRDVTWTQWVDYVFAGGSILAGLHACIYRLFLWPERPRLAALWSAACILLLIAHCAYLYNDFDFSYNMTANLTVGLLQIVLWIAWAGLKHTRDTWRPAIPLVLLLGASLFEVHDFAPVPTQLRLIDAHALWHLSTVPVVFLWYKFLVWDLERA